jgi:hypothetical protein
MKNDMEPRQWPDGFETFQLWFGWIMIYLFGGMVWNFAFKLYNRMENLRPGGGFSNYTLYLHKRINRPKYILTNDECVIEGIHNTVKWEGPDNFGAWRCPGCGIHGGGL